ncbi:chaperone protein dnaJ-related [Zea mays]|uniref:Chaperone protein dnaJ-related n=1 Tax=Zea mays TaxID=4577 RepID=A0A1D6HA01_MAIZE|nr:chaperone protein dnaJ-related [Zea mays]
MSCLAAPPAAPPKAGERMLRAAAPLRSPSPCRGLHYAVRGTGGREAGCGRRQLALLRCSPAGESRASGDGGLSSFCIIEGPETIEDFAQMQSQEIEDNIMSRRNKIFLLMEESPKTMKQLYMTSFSVISGIIIFGGLIAPVLELKLGLGGTSYEDFIRTLHLPLQLSQVDPIVASFSGGAVGVISALMLVEVRNVRQQEKKRCTYCHGTGYLPCARCSASGMLLNTKQFSLLGHNMWSMKGRCQNCSGAGKVMCPTCLCTGMAMASEHDPRIDPFD